MADIPGANPDPTVRPEAMPTPFDGTRASPEDFGAGTGALVEQQGAQLGRVGMEYQQRANYAVDEQTIAKAYAVAGSKIRDPQSGFASLRGQDAINKLPEAQEDFRNGIAQIRQSLSPAQMQRIGFRLDRIEKDGLFDAASWAKQQGHIAAEAAFHGAETAASDRLAQLAGDPNASPDQLKSTLLELTSTAIARAKGRYGEAASPDAIKGEMISTLGTAVPKAMSEAMATGDPQRAQAAYKLFQPYLGVHANYYAGVVGKMQAQHLVDHESERILGAATQTIPMPDGTAIARIDETKAAAELAKMNPGDPNRADIESRTNAKIKAVNEVSSKTGAQMFSDAERLGTDPSTGEFSIARVPAPLKQWLQHYATDPKTNGLIALRTLDYRAQRQDSGEDRKVSAGNYSDLLAEMVDPVKRREHFGRMDANEFKSYLRDEDRFPGGFVDLDKDKALRQFNAIKTGRNGVGTLEETAAKAAPEIIKAAFPNNASKLKKYAGPLTDALNDFIDDYKTRNKGVAPTSEEVRKFGASEFAKGSVTAVGEEPGWYGRHFGLQNRLDVERNVGGSFGAKQFTPIVDGEASGPPIIPASPRARAQTVAPPMIKTKADYDALPPGSDYIDGRTGVRKRKS